MVTGATGLTNSDHGHQHLAGYRPVDRQIRGTRRVVGQLADRRNVIICGGGMDARPLLLPRAFDGGWLLALPNPPYPLPAPDPTIRLLIGIEILLERPPEACARGPMCVARPGRDCNYASRDCEDDGSSMDDGSDDDRWKRCRLERGRPGASYLWISRSVSAR